MRPPILSPPPARPISPRMWISRRWPRRRPRRAFPPLPAGHVPRAARHRRAGRGAGAWPFRLGARQPHGRISPLDRGRGNGDALQGAGPLPRPVRPTTRTGAMTLEIITADALSPLRHGFFTRRGGASSGVFSGLNCGPGSSDQSEIVSINRTRVAEAMQVAPDHLVTVRQVHSADVAASPPRCKSARAPTPSSPPPPASRSPCLQPIASRCSWPMQRPA